MCEVNKNKNQTIIIPKGNLIEERCQKFRQCIVNLLNQNIKNICFDLSNVEIISTEALLILFQLSKKITQTGIQVTNSSQINLDLLELTKIIQPVNKHLDNSE